MGAEWDIFGEDVLYTLGDVKSALSWPDADKKCLVMVEGKADSDCYSKVLQGKDVIIIKAGYVARDGVKRGGFRVVKTIVKSILESGMTRGIIGIVDKDYTMFRKSPIVHADNIFTTDKRDLEMMLWSIDAVSSFMVTRLSGESHNEDWRLDAVKLDKIKQISRYMGSLHISDVWHGLRCEHEFHNRLYWDFVSHDFKVDWETNIFLYFVNQCASMQTPVTFTQEMLDESNTRFDMENQDFCDIARGHDFLTILSHVMVDTNTYSEDNLTNMMISYITPVMFSTTNLWRAIADWQTREGYSVAS